LLFERSSSSSCASSDVPIYESAPLRVVDVRVAAGHHGVDVDACRDGRGPPGAPSADLECISLGTLILRLSLRFVRRSDAMLVMSYSCWFTDFQ
jgi:hypothetical protein